MGRRWRAPRFDIVCLRNYGELGPGNGPADDEALALITSAAVEPQNKLATTWSDLKSQ
ncbi:hypothetical protein HN371_23975 [Candidatus Poribacteria bacterium]|nr:hypothetical protein [Candidatus Poribacteria bacterium]MBT5535215.1 hypothetical protein [Candidatus Poribacteria bacterium]MBT5713795.1 hypothetical protein [Candidatus Poribacteria bacterium]MBT7808483.1 hypothetical protein [Candidatus Poribacteria bacterium]